MPLLVDVLGSLHYGQWVPALEAMHVPKHVELMLQAALASVRSFHLLHVCLHKNKHAGCSHVEEQEKLMPRRFGGGSSPHPYGS